MSETPKTPEQGVPDPGVPDHSVHQREVPSAEGHVASTGSEASAAYGEGSIQILEGLEAVRRRVLAEKNDGPVPPSVPLRRTPARCGPC